MAPVITRSPSRQKGDDLLVVSRAQLYGNEGDPLYDPNRHARVQKLYWNEDGTPYFGIPVPDGPLPVRFRAASEEVAYLAHDGDRAILDANLTQIERSQFRVIPGLADADAYSLESTNQPGHYLRHRDGVIWLEADDGSEPFTSDATWQITRAEGRAEGIWIESYNMSGAGIVAQEGALVLGPLAEDGAGGGAFVVER